MLEVHTKPPHSEADTHSGRRMHGVAAELLAVLGEVEAERLDQWRWQSFVGEEAALEVLFAESPDTPAKRCLVKVCGVCLGWAGLAGVLRVQAKACLPCCCRHLFCSWCSLLPDYHHLHHHATSPVAGHARWPR